MANPPTGKYINVTARNIQGKGGDLTDGTGTYDGAMLTMSCGPFTDRPIIGDSYNLTGKYEKDKEFYTFDKYKCLTSDATAQFRDETRQRSDTRSSVRSEKE